MADAWQRLGREARRGALRPWPALVTMCLLALGAGGCGNDPEPDADAGNDAADVAVDVGDDAAADVAADVAKGTLKWTSATPPMDGKVLAAAVVPGAVDHYVVVGQDGGIVRVAGAEMTAVQAAGVGKNHLNAVWVSADGTAWIGGDGSTLVHGKGDDWQTVAEIPPSPPVRFRAVDGDESAIWAVGDKGEAWRRGSEGVFAPAAVSVTEGEAPSDDAAFVDVVVAGEVVWLLADLGSASPGVAIEKTASGWRGHALAGSPRAMWRAPEGMVWVVGGTEAPFVSRWDGKAWQTESAEALQWQLGFTAVAGLGADDVALGALKGQVRRFDGAAFSVVLVAPPPGTPNPFAQPSGDIAAIARHDASSWLVATPFFLYRYGWTP
jgi:hypothetical protein